MGFELTTEILTMITTDLNKTTAIVHMTIGVR
jgi:hypothetical protein